MCTCVKFLNVDDSTTAIIALYHSFLSIRVHPCSSLFFLQIYLINDKHFEYEHLTDPSQNDLSYETQNFINFKS